MNFEKDFPELRDKIRNDNIRKDFDVWCFDIQEYCLSKQRVKEAIELWTDMNGIIRSPNSLKKTLGLK